MHLNVLNYDNCPSIGRYLFLNPVRYIYIYIYQQISGWQFSPVLIGSRNSEYPWTFTVLRTERELARRFAKVSKEAIKTAFFHPSDSVNTKTTIPLRVGEEQRIYVKWTSH